MDETCRTFLKDGSSYLKTARGGLNRPSVFTRDILYNILAMSIEKSIMGILIFHNTLADNHTFSDLVDSLSRVIDIDASVAADLLEFERYQAICSVFDGYLRTRITDTVISRMIDTATLIESLAAQTCTPG